MDEEVHDKGRCCQQIKREDRLTRKKRQRQNKSFVRPSLTRRTKGQVTIFIIIGIIILMAAALLFYLREREIIFTPRPPLIPTEVAPIDDYIKSCISELGAEAAEIIGRTGGYIRYPAEIEGDTLSYIHLSPLETGKNPYWYFQGERRIPTEEYIVGEMDHYITTNLRECLGNLEVFSEQYDIKELGGIAARTTLGEEGIPVEVDYPIEVSDKQGRKIKTFDAPFEVVVPYRLKTAYEVATQIMEAEEEDAKLEEITIDLIALDTDIPYSNLEFSCSRRRWKISDVENKLKTLLRTDLPLIRVDTTSYSPVPVDQPYVLNHFVWDVTDIPYPDIKVGFTYDDAWPLHLNARPSSGGYLEAGMQKGSQIASWLCIQMWKFTYDVIYPVMVTVVDEKTGYSFSFSFRVLVDHNQANRQAFSHSVFEYEPYEAVEEYCGRRVNDITVLTYDNVSDDYLPIEGVNLTYTCLKYACNIGVSEYASGGAVASVTEKFPYCVWGVLKGTKPGYEDGQVFFGSDEPKTVEIYLRPLKQIQAYKVVKHKLDWDSQLIGDAEELGKSEYATITVERDDLSSYGIYPGGEPAPLTFLAEEDYDYKVTVYLADNETIKGGYAADWTADWFDLAGADEAVFHVIYMDRFENEVQELAFISGLGTYSKQIPAPELK